MGNAVVSRRPPGTSTGKVILSDGTIHEFNTPITAAELMLDHPRHVVVEISRDPSFRTSCSGSGKGNRIIPLPADKNLEREKLYLMLPMRRNRGKTSTYFSVQEIQRVAMRLKKRDVSSSLDMLSSATTGFVPLLVRFVCAVGSSGSEIESIVKMTTTRKGRFLEEEEILPASASEIWPECRLSGRKWKPSLDTIVEKGVKQKHWLVYI